MNAHLTGITLFGQPLSDGPVYYSVIGNTLKSDLDAPKNSLNFSVAIGYIRGVFDAHSALSVIAYGQKTYNCWTKQYSIKNVDALQLASIVSKYLNNHPDQWQYNANSLVFIALDDAFPYTKEIMACGKKSGSTSKFDWSKQKLAPNQNKSEQNDPLHIR